MSKPTLWSREDREGLTKRVSGFGLTAEPRWGRLTAPRVICHLGDQLRLALGDIAASPPAGPLRFRPIAYPMIHWLPWPKGAAGPPDAFTTAPEEFEEDRDALLDLIERFAEMDPGTEWPPHPTFGHLTGEDWGVLSGRHLDHHLTQFGQ